MQLKAVIPRTHVDGFSVSILTRRKSIATDPLYEDLFIDYIFEVCVEYDGKRSGYGERKLFYFLITQYITDTTCTFSGPDMVIALQKREHLQYIKVVEHNKTSVILEIGTGTTKAADIQQFTLCERVTATP